MTENRDDIMDKGYTGVERRRSIDRRQLVDKRSSIRFDDNGGDRRQGGRRSTDVSLDFLEI